MQDFDDFYLKEGLRGVFKSTGEFDRRTRIGKASGLRNDYKRMLYASLVRQARAKVKSAEKSMKNLDPLSSEGRIFKELLKAHRETADHYDKKIRELDKKRLAIVNRHRKGWKRPPLSFKESYIDLLNDLILEGEVIYNRIPWKGSVTNPTPEQRAERQKTFFKALSSDRLSEFILSRYEPVRPGYSDSLKIWDIVDDSEKFGHRFRYDDVLDWFRSKNARVIYASDGGHQVLGWKIKV